MIGGESMKGFTNGERLAIYCLIGVLAIGFVFWVVLMRNDEVIVHNQRRIFDAIGELSGAAG